MINEETLAQDILDCLNMDVGDARRRDTSFRAAHARVFGIWSYQDIDKADIEARLLSRNIRYTAEARAMASIGPCLMAPGSEHIGVGIWLLPDKQDGTITPSKG
jgi:hypothetical protein